MAHQTFSEEEHAHAATKTVQYCTGCGYLAGAIFGGSKGALESIRGDSLKLRMNRILNSGTKFGISLGFVGLMYAGIKTELDYHRRGGDDVLHSVLAGLGSGAFYKARSGVRSAAVAGAIGGIAAGSLVSVKQGMHLYTVEESKNCLNAKQGDGANTYLPEEKRTGTFSSRSVRSPATVEKSRAEQSYLRNSLSPIDNCLSVVKQEDGVNACLPDEGIRKETQTCTPSSKYVQLQEIVEMITAVQSSLRHWLSPIYNNSNMKPYEDITSRDCMDPKTPKTPYILTRNSDEFLGASATMEPITPLEKYKERSSHLKGYLVHEYLDFLNSASKEELVKVKGIGHKRAEHIVQLRETSPLKSLCDMEMAGFSSKQVDDLFWGATRGIQD